MGRRTVKDRAFAAMFGDKLEAAFKKYVKDKSNPDRISVQKFAKSLNLTRAGLHKAMRGKSVPKLDLIDRARNYGVNVGYGELDPQKASLKKKSSDLQLFLPFAVENLKKDNVRIELGEHKQDTVEVRLWIKFVG